MSADRHTLSDIRLLGGIDEAALKGIEERCVWRRYRSGERIFERGTEGHEVFFVVEGSVDWEAIGLLVVLHRLDVSCFGSDQHDGRARFVQRIARLGELRLLDAVGGEDGDS